MSKIELLIKSEQDTIRLAQQMATHFHQGDVLILDGDLGTGKTFFTKAFAQALDCQNNVTSPTFTIAQFYNTSKGQLLHIDAYRIASITEFWELGLMDYFDETITLIEWGSKVASEIDAFFMMKIEHSEGGEDFRKVTISFKGAVLEEKFSQLKLDIKVSDFLKASDTSKN